MFTKVLLIMWVVFVEFFVNVSNTDWTLDHYDLNSWPIPLNNNPYGAEKHIPRVGKNFRMVPNTQLENAEKKAVEPPLRIGSFNVQTLSKKKFNNANVMITVEKVIHRYDLILIMEIILNQDEPIHSLLQSVNRYAPEGIVYNVTISSKLGGEDSVSKEQYAFFYRTDKLKVIRTELYHNVDKVFFRTPYMVFFEAFTLRDLKQFVVVGLHAKPDRAAVEISALAQVYDFIKHMHGVEDVLMMGDFNAACSYVGEFAWNSIDLWTREEFTWPIGHDVDTTTNHRSCALDRFVFSGRGMDDGVIAFSARPFNFKKAFGLTIEETRSVSDHWPIEIQIRGKMSGVAETHLRTEVCVTMGDSRSVTIPVEEAALNGSQTAGFSFTKELDGFTLLNTSSSESLALGSLRTLRKVFPHLVTSEQFQGILYKVARGSLEDTTSFVDVAYPSFDVTLEVKKEFATIRVCRKTTVN